MRVVFNLDDSFLTTVQCFYPRISLRLGGFTRDIYAIVVENFVFLAKLLPQRLEDAKNLEVINFKINS